MARGLTDPIEEDDNASAQDELDAVISNLIMAQNRLHDRLVSIERTLDHMATVNTSHTESPEHEAADRKRWKRGL